MMNSIMNDTAISGAGLTLVTGSQSSGHLVNQQQHQPQVLTSVTGQQQQMPTHLLVQQPQQQQQAMQVQVQPHIQNNVVLHHNLNNNNTSNSNNHHPHPLSTGTTGTAAAASAVPPPAPPAPVVLSKQRLHELVQEIDPTEQLDEEVEEALLHMADDFIDATVTAACQMARHRDSRSLEVRDVQLVLEKEWNISIPGFGNPLSQLNRFKSHSATTEAHKQRLALIKKTLRKM